jgi:hypothetical protein
MKVKPLLLFGLLWTTMVFGQGTTANILYTWHGNSGYFQASFQVTPDENQPGQYFEFGPFKSTFSVTSPDDTYPAAGGSFSGEDVSGFGPPLKLSVTMTDPVGGKGVEVFGSSGFFMIDEYLLSNPGVIPWRESGYWTSAPLPEPSILSLAGLAMVLWWTRVCREWVGYSQ